MVRLEVWVCFRHVSCSLKWSVWISRDRNHFQDAMYLLLSSVHFPNGARRLDLLSLHKVVSVFLHVLHADIDFWFFLG